MRRMKPSCDGCLRGGTQCRRDGLLRFVADSRLHDLADEFAFDECEAFFSAEVGVGELVLVEAELVQDGRVDVAELVGLLEHRRGGTP